jgi:tetratricopeptide (TPR) repeat protein
MKAYNTAISIDPNYADAYYNRGNLKTQNNNNEEALEDFNNAIKLNPKDSASYNNRGVVKRKLNYNVGALSDFSIAIRLDPEDITAHANRGHLKKRYFDSEGAEEDFKTAINLASESPVLVKQIELENKVAAHQKPTVASATPDSVKFDSAPAEMNKALRMPKVKTIDDIQKIVSKYNVKSNQEENIKTAVVKASVVKMEPSNVKPIAKTQTAPVNAIPDITTKPVINPELAECYYIRALQKYILQNRESALKDFDMAIKHNPNYAEAYYYRAAIKRDFKDNGFVDDYKKAIELDPKLKSVEEANVLTILKI